MSKANTSTVTPSHELAPVCAEVYGSIRAELAFRGTPIGPNDLLIASIALANHLTLVTHNFAEFQRVPSLRAEDWETPDGYLD